MDPDFAQVEARERFDEFQLVPDKLPGPPVEPHRARNRVILTIVGITVVFVTILALVAPEGNSVAPQPGLDQERFAGAPAARGQDSAVADADTAQNTGSNALKASTSSVDRQREILPASHAEVSVPARDANPVRSVTTTESRNIANRWVRSGYQAYSLGDFPEAVRCYERAIERAPDLIAPINNLAWLRATCPRDEFRDGEEAVTLALKSIALASERDHIMWFQYGTLAAAYAENGEFESAVEYQRMAISLAPTDQFETASIRLSLYQSRQPYRGSDN